MSYRLCASDVDSVFAKYGPTLAYAPLAAREAHPLIENIWVQTNRYAKQLVLEVWWTREVTREEATESVRAVRTAIEPWFEVEGIDESWHITARRGRRRSTEPWLHLVPLLVDDYRVTTVRTRWPKEPEYVDRTPKDVREARTGVKKATPPSVEKKARSRR